MTIETRGKNLILRPMTQKEHRALWRKYSPDPSDGRTYDYNEEKVDALYEAMLKNSDWCPTAGIFTPNGEIIGMAQLPRIVFSENRCDVYIMLANESYRGKGLGAEALRLLTRAAHEKAGMDRFYAEVPASNARARSAFESCGFKNSRVRGDILDYVLRMTL